MARTCILGAGTIGSLIAHLLADCGDYAVDLVDSREDALHRAKFDLPGLQLYCLDVRDRSALAAHLQHTDPDAVISALPYRCNPLVADLAAEQGRHYFDLTEDVEVTRHVRALSSGVDAVFVPQCGLAPGFVSIVAAHLMSHFDSVDTVKLRVGALPVHPSNVLKYSLTWSTDGLINEYGNPCYGLHDGREVVLMPLEGYETVEIDGLLYEAFNTSGGLGTLADTFAGRVQTMNYKTLRYPGHCEKIHFLMQDLRLRHDRETLKRILENAIPKTFNDVVLIYVSATGQQNGEFMEENYVKKVYPQARFGRRWSAIQVTTAGGLCAVVDLVLTHPGRRRGFVTQESFPMEEILENRFGAVFR